jgi:hypothetical protein
MNSNYFAFHGEKEIFGSLICFFFLKKFISYTVFYMNVFFFLFLSLFSEPLKVDQKSKCANRPTSNEFINSINTIYLS